MSAKTTILVAVLAGALGTAGCWRSHELSLDQSPGDTASDSDTDSDSDGDGDTDTDADDSDTDTAEGPDTETCADIPIPEGCVRFVSASAEPNGDGLGWCTAFQKVHDGIESAFDALEGDPEIENCQVWVAQGTYTLVAPGDTILLRPGVEVYGGFAGLESELTERDWRANVTTLDGDGIAVHVVTGSNGSVLDGFTVTGGSGGEQGGGFRSAGCSPTVRNCVFTGNSVSGAHAKGGGAYVQGGAPSFSDCEFSDNSVSGSHAHGGGLYVWSSDATIVRCTFFSNSATGDLGFGGGLYVFYGSAQIEGCVFLGNSAGAYGGGVNLDGDNSTIVNSTFTGNFGGGATVETGGGDLSGCIFHGNSFEIGAWTSETTVEYSLVQGGFDGTGNIDADPLFVDPDSGDLHLQPGSPCIDAADGTVAPEFDIEGNERIDDTDTPNTGIGPPWADMGAYEYQP